MGSASGQNDSTTTGGSMDGLDPNTSCMSSKNCHVHAVVWPSSVPLPESGFFSSCSKQIEICIYENILALLTENHLNNTFIHLLERHCCPHTLYFFFKFSHFFDACWEVTFPSRPSSLISVLYHKYEEWCKHCEEQANVGCDLLTNTTEWDIFGASCTTSDRMRCQNTHVNNKSENNRTYAVKQPKTILTPKAF